MPALTELTGAVGRTSPESQPVTRCCSSEDLDLGGGGGAQNSSLSPSLPGSSCRGPPAVPAWHIRDACSQPRRPAPIGRSPGHCVLFICADSVSVSGHRAHCLITTQQRARESPVTALFGSYSFFAAHSISEKKKKKKKGALLATRQQRGGGGAAGRPASPLLLLPVSGVN